MLYARQSENTLDQVIKKLEAAVAAHKFGILGVHDLKEKMAAKGVAFDHECRVFEVCNPIQAKKVLDADMSIANALPCRVCVYEQGGKICVSTIKPTFMLSLFHNDKLQDVAKEVEATIIAIIDAACQ
ncbi:MAG: DUF302 domain-containing protein [Candidatus Hydrogenedentes bacterium]|nr:DUF302 domain-containing protein [Candidatus Hydrogenedentota bacterium]